MGSDGVRAGIVIGEFVEPWNASVAAIWTIWRSAGLDLLPGAQFLGQNVGRGVDGKVGIGGGEDDNGTC